MRSLWLRLRPAEEARHPIHRAFCESPDLGREYVLSGQVSDGVETLVTYVEGDPGAYVAAVEAIDWVHEVDVAAGDGEGSFAYVRADVRETERRLGAAMDRETVVWIPPAVFRGDGTMSFTLVGHPEDLRGAVEDLPASLSVADLRVSDHTARFGSVLTERQREALTAALDAGYYDQPRTARLSEVAERLDLARGAASELLRRGERELVRAAVGRTGPGPGAIGR